MVTQTHSKSEMQSQLIEKPKTLASQCMTTCKFALHDVLLRLHCLGGMSSYSCICVAQRRGGGGSCTRQARIAIAPSSPIPCPVSGKKLIDATNCQHSSDISGRCPNPRPFKSLGLAWLSWMVTPERGSREGDDHRVCCGQGTACPGHERVNLRPNYNSTLYRHCCRHLSL